jgi:hypothetical protein
MNHFGIMKDLSEAWASYGVDIKTAVFWDVTQCRKYSLE